MLLRRNGMASIQSPTSDGDIPAFTLPLADRERVLRFAASFVWADLEVADSERSFLALLARELGIDKAKADHLLELPPLPEDVDPGSIGRRMADTVRRVALQAIAIDGEVKEEEMSMFELLDDLLPGRGS
jgi:hypothetical protein